MNHIVSNPEVLGGKPVIAGTRISVEFVLELFASGLSEREILPDAELLASAHQKRRWMLTHDADFGRLVVQQGHPFQGILYLRLKDSAPANVIASLRRLLLQNPDLPEHALVVLGTTKLRIRPQVRTR